MTTQTILAAANTGSDPQAILRGIVLFIVMPIMGIMAAFAIKGGKVTALLGIGLAAVVALTFAFGPASTFRQIGEAGANAISAVLNLSG